MKARISDPSETTYRLDAIPEVHPINRIIDIFEDYEATAQDRELWMGPIRHGFLGYVAKIGLVENPRGLADKRMMNLLGESLREGYRRASDAQGNPRPLNELVQAATKRLATGKTTTEMLREDEVAILSRVELARRVWENQFAQIDSGQHTRLYREGDKDCPLAVYARKRGITVVNLDDEGYIEQVKSDNERKAQARREDGWVAKIEPDAQGERSLIVAGADHIQNRFGLVDKLLRKGIRIHPIHTGYDELEFEIERELQQALYVVT